MAQLKKKYRPLRLDLPLPAREVRTLEEVEAEYLASVFETLRPRTAWADIARELGIRPKTLRAKRKKYDLP